MEIVKSYIEVTVTDKQSKFKRTFQEDSLFKVFKEMQEKNVIENYLDDNQMLIQELEYYIELPDVNSDEIYEIDFDKKVSELSFEQLKKVIRSYFNGTKWLSFEKIQDIQINGHTLRVSENTYHCLDAYLKHVEHCGYYEGWQDDAEREEYNFTSNLCADNNVDILLDILEKCECTFDELTEELRTLNF